MDDAVYTVLAVLGVCTVLALVAGTALILGTVFASWLGLILGAVL